MTDEEIKKIKVEVSDRLYSIYGFSTAVKAITCRTIDEILEDYCIVPKVEILNQHAWYMQRMKEVSSNRQMNRGKAIALETLFGKEMFEEDKK